MRRRMLRTPRIRRSIELETCVFVRAAPRGMNIGTASTWEPGYGRRWLVPSTASHRLEMA